MSEFIKQLASDGKSILQGSAAAILICLCMIAGVFICIGFTHLLIFIIELFV